MQLKRSKRPAWEYSVVGLVVGLAMWMAASLYAKRDQVFKERLLILELQTLRNLSAAYIFEHKKRHAPPLTIDPFGYPYQYHPNNGWVSTTHPRYRHW